MTSTFLVNIGSTLAALVGALVVLVALVMAWQAFGDARRAKPKGGAGDTKVMMGELQLTPGIPDEAIKVLPDLVKTAAGLAIAVMLLGTVLLVGASFTGETSASPSPTPTESAGASPSPS